MYFFAFATYVFYCSFIWNQYILQKKKIRGIIARNVEGGGGGVPFHPPGLIRVKPTQNVISRCPNICLSWTCTRRRARASLQPINRSNFIHQKSIFRLCDILCYRQYFIDDNRLTFKSNPAHHYHTPSLSFLFFL